MIKPPKQYEDNKFYPFYINHMFVEVSGREVKNWLSNDTVIMTRRMYNDILTRLDSLERKVL